MDTYRKKDGFENEKLLILPRDVVLMMSGQPLTKNLYITDIGFFPHAQYHYTERKEGTNQNILIYCVNGEGFLIIHGKKQKVPKGSAIIIPKNTPHSYGSNTDNPWDIYWMHFNGELAEEYFKVDNFSPIIDVPLSNLPILINLFRSIFDALTRGYTLSNIIYASQCFSHFLASIFYMPYNRHDYKDKHIKYVENSINFMEQNLDKNLLLDELASYNNLSKSQFIQVFKTKTGYSPIDFFIHLKIQKACSYLDLTDLTISEIALKVGYSDQYYFSRIFKKYMGLCPSDYRKIKKG